MYVIVTYLYAAKSGLLRAVRGRILKAGQNSYWKVDIKKGVERSSICISIHTNNHRTQPSKKGPLKRYYDVYLKLILKI